MHDKDDDDVEYCQSDDEESDGDNTEEEDNSGDVIVASGDVYINVRNSGGCWGHSGGYGGHGDDSHSGVSCVVISGPDGGCDGNIHSGVKVFHGGGWGDTRKIPKVAYAVDDDTVAIPVEGAVGDTGSMPTMMWEDYSTVGDGGDVHDNACSTDSFSGFLDPGG